MTDMTSEGDIPQPSEPQSVEEAEKALAEILAQAEDEDVVDGQDVAGDDIDGPFSWMTLSSGSEAGDYRYVYRMDFPRRGLAIIINNKSFEERTKLDERLGTDVDAANLYDAFTMLGFDTHLSHNLSTTNMLRLLKQASEADHSDADCFACAILSHGDQGYVYGTDGIIHIDDLVAPFKGGKCPGLAGKPKLFFIQACRGLKLDDGILASDSRSSSEPQVKRIPSEADFLMAYSTVPGYFSWRNKAKGTWFCQALCQVLREHAAEKEIMWIMTRVNCIVAYDFESNVSDSFMHKKKQIPSIVSMLTKELYLKPKAKK